MKVVKVLLAVCCLVVVGILGYKAHVRAQVAKATDVALDYVEKKYPFDVKCVGGEYFAFDDPWQYYIRFETTNQEPFYFTVLVHHDFKISEERYSTSGEARLVADNYFHCKFAKEAETYIKNVLGEDRALKDVLVYCNYSALYAFALPVDVSETDSLDELLQKMDFNVVLYYDNIESSQFEKIGKSLQEHGVHARNVLIKTEDTGDDPYISAGDPVKIGKMESFTQSDWDSNFVNYATADATAVLPVTQDEDGDVSNVVGTVFSKETNEGIANAVVTVSDMDDEEVLSVTTDASGRFHILGLPGGFYHWTLEHPEYCDSKYIGYDVCGGITTMFTFYMSTDETLERSSFHYQDLFSRPD